MLEGYSELTDEEYSFDSDDDDLISGETEINSYKLYQAACRRCMTSPVKHVSDQINDRSIDLENRCLSSCDIKALCIALVGNVSVTKLNLAGNSIGPRGASWVAQVISENQYISYLNLSNNHIGSRGIQYLARPLTQSKRIEILDLSGNELLEKDAKYIATILEKNKCLKELNLAHNEFREVGGELLAPALEENTTLHRLDLSWNHLRMKGAASLAASLEFNTGLKYLNLSWNGFCVEGCQQLQVALERNTSLTELDLSSNRIESRALSYIMKGVSKNTHLKTLRLGCNPIHCEVANKILEEYKNSTICALTTVDITNVTIDDDFQKILNEIQRTRPIKIIHGAIVNVCRRGINRQKSVFDVPTDPLFILFEYMKQSNLRLVDFFHVLDKDSSETVSKSEFRQVLQRVNIPMTERALNALMKRLDANNDGQVDFGEFVTGHRDNLRKLSVITEDPVKAEEIGKIKVKVKTFLELKKVKSQKIKSSESQTTVTSPRLPEISSRERQESTSSYTEKYEWRRV